MRQSIYERVNGTSRRPSRLRESAAYEHRYFSDVCNYITDAVEELGQEKAVDLLVEAILNVEFDDDEAALEQIRTSL